MFKYAKEKLLPKSGYILMRFQKRYPKYLFLDILVY